jgi:hypothetical protein
MIRGSTDGVTPVNISLGRIFGISAAAVALTVLGFTAQAQMKEKAAPKPPACSKIKDEAACKARDNCNWTAEVKDAKGKVKKKGSSGQAETAGLQEGQDEAACKHNDCTWTTEVKDAKAKVKKRSSCKVKPKPKPEKKPAPKKK